MVIFIPCSQAREAKGNTYLFTRYIFGDHVFSNRPFVHLFSNVLQHIRLRFLQCNDKMNPVEPHKFSRYFYKAVRSIDSIEVKGPFL